VNSTFKNHYKLIDKYINMKTGVLSLQF